MQQWIRRLGATAGVAALAAGGLVMVAPLAGAAPSQSTVCATQTLVGVVITGSITVPGTSHCNIVGATITGNVQIGTQASVEIVTGSSIGGSVSVGTFSTLDVFQSTIGKNVTGNSVLVVLGTQFEYFFTFLTEFFGSLQSYTPLTFPIIPFTSTTNVGGNVSTGTGGLLGMFGASVAGNVSTGFGGALADIGSVVGGNLTTSSSLEVALLDAGVTGNARLYGTLGTFFICGGACSLASGFVGSTPTTNPQHPYKLSNVSIMTSQGEAVFALNYVTGNLTCSGNAELFTTSNVVLGHASGQCATT